MSLLTVAQATTGLRVACNFDTAATDKVNGTGVTSSTITTSGTFTQNASSLTGAKSYDLSNSARAYVTWSDGTGTGTDSVIQEYVFKKSSAPGTGNYEHLGDFLGTGTIGDSFQVGIGPTGDIYLNIKNGSGTTTGVSSGGNYCDGNWHHVVASYMNPASSTGVRLYIDGTLIATDTTIGNLGDSNKWNIGSFVSNSNTSPSSYFNGTMDFAAVYVGTSYTNAQMDTLVSDHVASYANGGYAAQASTATALMTTATPYSNTLTAEALGDRASYVFTLDSTITQVLGDAMTGGRTFSTPTNTATYRAGRSATGGTGSWEIANTNTTGNEITFVESTTPNITHEKGLSIETVFYYPAYVTTDTAGQSIFVKSWSTGGVELKLNASGGNNYIEAGFSGPGYITHSTALVPGRWYHVVAQWDPADDYTYLTVNDVTEVSASKNTGSGNNFANTNSFNLGADSGLSIDFVALYSSVYNGKFLSSAEIGHHYDTFEALRYIQQSKTVAATPMTATASIPKAGTVNATALTAFATIVDPLAVTAIRNKTITATALTASALFDPPVFSAGANHGALHMNASADMGQESRPTIPGVVFANPMIVNANITEPVVTSELGVLIKSQSLNANAFFSLPPAYYLVSDDRWYQRLLDVDYQSAAFGGKLTFFNTSESIYLGDSYDGWTAQENRSPLQPYYGYNLYDTPLPTASAGHFDILNRKALNLRNIALTYADRETYSQGWTMEAMIQTTKKNQFIAAGYYLGDTSSSTSRNKRTAFRLKDGKIALTKVKDSTLGQYTSADAIDWTGFKDIADGEWHHIILQYRDEDSRVQVWIDGELDIQRYASTAYIPNQIGFNSNDINAYSDFKISGIAINKESFVLERETKLNYFAAFGITPFEATPAKASVEFGTGTRGKGNRARALMLYFWPTFNAQSGYYVGQYSDPFSPVGVNTSDGHDVGAEPFDYDTFHGLSTYLTDNVQTYFDWDVFPLPVKKFYSGDTYRGDKHPLLNESVLIDNGPNGRTYVDPVTDNYRYLNLLEDVYELDQYDAIFFRNYPDQSKEQDEMGLNSKTEVDEYFNIQEKTLFASFLDSLREAVDTYNISLFVTNPQLAKDLGIIANATDVPLLRDRGTFLEDEWSDNRGPVVTGRIKNDGSPLDMVNEYGAGWYDTWLNDRHRVINTLEYLTDDNAFIWTDYAFYQNSDYQEYGGPDRLYKRYENRPYGLQIDDEFVFSDSGNPRFRLPYQAVKPEDLLAGVPITALSKKIWNQKDETSELVDNPYKDYITSIALPVGTNLKGKLTGGKIFVSFSENIAADVTSDSPQWNTEYNEYHPYDMSTEYWVNIAYNAKLIDEETKNAYLNGTAGQPALFPNTDTIKQYWSYNGDNVVSRLATITGNLSGFVGGDLLGLVVDPSSKKRTRSGLTNIPLANSTRVRDALGRFAGSADSSSLTGGGLQSFQVILGRKYNTGIVFIPSINTRGMWWLSDKVRLTGTVLGFPAVKANAQMKQPLVIAEHPGNVIAGAMIATATINDSQFAPADKKIVALPMYASATIVNIFNKYINAEPARASAKTIDPIILGLLRDQAVMYLHHVNPTLYLRKEVVK